MHDPVPVGRIERDRRLLEPLERLSNILRPPLADPLLERAATQVFHDDEWTLLVLADVEDGDDVGLPGQPRRGERLAREAPAHLLVARVALGEQLDRDGAPQRIVGRPVDLTHAAGGDALRRAVARRQDASLDGHA